MFDLSVPISEEERAVPFRSPLPIDALLNDSDTYRYLFAANPQPMWVYDTKTLRFLAVNDAACAHYGYRREAFLTMTLADIRPAEDVPAMRREVETRSRHIPGAGVYRHRKGNGEIVWSEVLSCGLLFHGYEARLVVSTDVTERRQAQEALQESQRRLASLIDALPGIVFSTNNAADWTMTYLSEGCLPLTGYSSWELVGNGPVTYNSITHPDDLDRILGVIADAVERRQPYVVEYRLRTKGGEEKWVWEKGNGVFDESGATLGLEGFITDITERKQAEEALRRTESRNRALLAAVPDLMLRISKDGIYLDISAPDIGQLVAPAEAILGKHVTDILPSALANQFLDSIERALQTGAIQLFEYQLQVAHGLCEYEARIAASGGHEVVAIVRDITKRKRAEEALYQAQENYRGLFENAVEGIFQTTPSGNYLNANPALARIYGYDSRQELIAHLTDIRQQLYVEPGRREEFAALMQEHGVVSDFESQVRRKDGSIIWIAENAREVRDAQGNLQRYEGTVEDITERKALEAERERLLAEALERADRDPLTGLLNHRAFHKRLDEEADRAQRDGKSLTIAVMDLDNFKFFNDAYGHTVGDDVLRQVAAVLRTCCRSYDVPARYGGDEFALLMPGASAEEAALVAERLSTTMEKAGYRPRGYDATIPLSLSVGIAVFPEEATTRVEALELADERLRRVKTGGDEEAPAERLRASLAHTVKGFSMLDALVTAVDNKDRYTRRHSEDVMVYALQIAGALGLNKELCHIVAVAALLHDVGKIGVPDHVLRKPGKLSNEEYQAIQQHPMMGAVMVGAVPGFEATLDAVRHHHERWDGQGYPFGLKGEASPLPARILAVADAFSAMTTDRPYRKGMAEDEARRRLKSGAGTQWDPVCVRAFLRARRGRPTPTT